MDTFFDKWLQSLAELHIANVTVWLVRNARVVRDYGGIVAIWFVWIGTVDARSVSAEVQDRSATCVKRTQEVADRVQNFYSCGFRILQRTEL